MWILAALGAVVALVVLSGSSKGSSAGSSQGDGAPPDISEDEFMGWATAYAILDSEPADNSVIQVDLKAAVGKPLGWQKVHVEGPAVAAVLPDGRAGRSKTGGLSDGNGHAVGAATLYFL